MTVSSPNRPAETVDRASDTDLAFLAMDAGGVPEQFAAVLVLAADAPVDGAAVEDTLAERVAAVPRLRQRLVRTPVGCGRRIWVDDAAFDARHHLRRLACRAPGDETALLELATNLVVDPLPQDRPLWRAAYVTGLAGGRTALVLVLHHALADGIGGLAILAELADDAVGTPVNGFPRPVPSPGTLAADALRGRLRSLRRATLTWRRSWTAMSAAGGLIPPRATACSLIAPTGPRRRAAVASADAGRLRAAARRHDGTVNAALLSAVTGALHELLLRRGEPVESLVVAVPVAGRWITTGAELGNQVSPLLVTLRATAPPADRIRQVAAAVRRHRALATGPPPIALLGPVFRMLAALGGYRWYMNHQRRLHTLVSYVHGPESPVRFAGATVVSVIPVVTGNAGNLTVAFQAVSYAGTLVITAVADPVRVPDLAVLMAALQAELDALCAEAEATPAVPTRRARR